MRNVSEGGLAAGWARGGAPRARLAVYKALWGQFGGTSASILAAIDDAVQDGVDVLNLSLGSTQDDDTWLLPSLHAIRRGIIMVYAGGNDGPYPQTVTNTSPWVITVAASAMDRSFPTAITLGDNTVLGVGTDAKFHRLGLPRNHRKLAGLFQGQAFYFGDKERDHVFTDIVFGGR